MLRLQAGEQGRLQRALWHPPLHSRLHQQQIPLMALALSAQYKVGHADLHALYSRYQML